jgi:hypothetical protein
MTDAQLAIFLSFAGTAFLGVSGYLARYMVRTVREAARLVGTDESRQETIRTQNKQIEVQKGCIDALEDRVAILSAALDAADKRIAEMQGTIADLERIVRDLRRIGHRKRSEVSMPWRPTAESRPSREPPGAGPANLRHGSEHGSESAPCGWCYALARGFIFLSPMAARGYGTPFYPATLRRSDANPDPVASAVCGDLPCGSAPDD